MDDSTAKPSAIALRQERSFDLRRTIDGGDETVSTRFQTIETRPGFVQLLQESNKMHFVFMSSSRNHISLLEVLRELLATESLVFSLRNDEFMLSDEEGAASLALWLPF